MGLAAVLIARLSPPRGWLAEQAAALAGYLAFAIALTWPLVRDFRTRLIGDVSFDMRHAVWIQWYLKEALLGRARWPETKLLHFPYGISTLVDGVGPLNGLAGLPFQPWGPAAAYNGALLLGVVLSGWCLYLLARHVRLDRASAFYAGLLFMASPIHLSAMYGHLEKAFIGLLPLSLLAGLLAFDLDRRWTIFAPGAVLLALLLQNANQFTFAALGLALLAIVRMVRTPRDRRRAQAIRIAVTGAVSLAICLPLIDVIVTSAYHPLMDVRFGNASGFYAADALQLIVPSIDQAIVGRWFYVSRGFTWDWTYTSTLPALTTHMLEWYGSGVETAVTIPLTALLLGVAAAWRIRRPDMRIEARVWLLLGLLFALLALGPTLRLAGSTTFTPWRIHIPMPQALLLQIPGFDVMRTPGRYMMMGMAGFAMAAGIGLMALGQRAGTRRRWAIAGTAALMLIECWPAPWHQHVLPPVPRFYQQIAQDREAYAVLDLPSPWPYNNNFGSAYQYYQIVHGKPIAWSYLSRSYARFPIMGLDALWDRSERHYDKTRRLLAKLGYRYVVWHKHAEALFAPLQPDPAIETGAANPAPALAETDPFMRWAFDGERPIYDDALVTVYRLAP